MKDLKEVKGSCLCGAVKITAKTVNKKLGACHCQMCRKWAGGPFLALDCGSEVSFQGEENIKVFDSSQWAERGFCKECGTHLFYRVRENKQHFVPVGLFDEIEDKDIIFDHQIFIDKKPAYYCFADRTEMLTEAEVFAQFAPKSE